MIVIPELMTTDDGRVLIFGMDPTLTLCPGCNEVICEDGELIANVHGDLGRLTHIRCLSANIFEQELLDQPPEAINDYR